MTAARRQQRVKNRDKIVHFVPVKFSGAIGQMSEWICQIQPTSPTHRKTHIIHVPYAPLYRHGQKDRLTANDSSTATLLTGAAQRAQKS